MKSMMAGVFSLLVSATMSAPPASSTEQGTNLRFVLAPSASQTPCGAEWENESRLLSISLIVDRNSTTDARTRSVTCKSLAARHDSSSDKRRIALRKKLYSSTEVLSGTSIRADTLDHQDETFSVLF